ncbi:swi5-dependent recombination DNA repair protein 1 homolog [Mixophyes fleayi]|uniref:swi5-dependent recombination DNA repair protein 1 homolog n=1 Tax=Mixophyes fleayi TaxID=3061075 RepID=UPI003F4DB8F1
METPSGCSPSLSNSKKYFGSPDPQNNISVKQPMSATLQERLRKSRRSFSSTCTVAKRLKIDSDESEIPVKCTGDPSPPQGVRKRTVETGETCGPLSSADSSIPEGKTSSLEAHKLVTSTDTSSQHPLQEKRGLLKRVEEKEEILRRLKMVKLYRSKNNLTELQCLIEKWRKSSQLLLYEIQTTLSAESKKISLTELIESCGLDEKLLHYNRTEEDFDE